MGGAYPLRPLTRTALDGAVAGVGITWPYISMDRVTTTVAAAIGTANARNALNGGYDMHPSYRRAVIIPAGTYTETLGILPPFIDLIGETGDPADVIITWSGAADTCRPMSSHTLSGITFEHTGTGYPLHPVQNPNGYYLPQVLALDNCVVRSVNAAANSAIAADVGPGCAMIFRKTAFSSVASSAVYLHTTATGSMPALVSFIDCTATTTTGSEAVSWFDLGGGQGDSFYWQGAAGSITGGSSVNLRVTRMNGAVTTPTATYYVNPTNYTTKAAPATQFSDIITPAPTTLARFDAFYNGNTKLPNPLTPLIPDTAAANPTALRIYWWPVRVDRCGRIGSYRVGVASAAGNVLTGIWTDDGTGKPGTLYNSGASTVVVGSTTRAANQQRQLYPGIYWLGVAFDDAAASIISSTNAPLTQPMYYQTLASLVGPNSATPVALTAGPVPIITARTS